MNRRELREHCFKMLFCADFYSEGELSEQLQQYFNAPKEYDFTPEGVEEILHSVELDVHDTEYLRNKVKDIMGKIPELDTKINAAAEGWKTKRMGKEELTILRLALYEILHDEEVPQKVAINEAVEVAKKFGGEDAPAFINGVLAKLV